MAFTMQVPDEAEIKKEIQEQAKPVSEELAPLQAQGEINAEEIMKKGIDELIESPEIRQIESFGKDSMKTSAAKTAPNSFLKIKIVNLSRDGQDEGDVVKGIGELQQVLRKLDPSRIDFRRRDSIINKLIDPVRIYFDKYEKADPVIKKIFYKLERGKKGLEDDNKTLVSEQKVIRTLTKKLHKEVQLGTRMAEVIEEQIEAASDRNEDPEKIRYIKEEILLPLRQKIKDMLQMIAVNQQAMISIEIVRRNNKELIRGVERAQIVTISALKTAVMIASALYRQNIIIDLLNQVDDLTNRIIIDNSVKIKDQGNAIQERLEKGDITVDTLIIAYANVMEELDEISNYKEKVQPKIKAEIIKLIDLVTNGEKQVQEMEKGNNALCENKGAKVSREMISGG